MEHSHLKLFYKKKAMIRLNKDMTLLDLIAVKKKDLTAVLQNGEKVKSKF